MRFISCIFLLVALAACGSSSQAPKGPTPEVEQNEDQSQTFLQALQGSRYLSQGSSLEFSPTGDFEFFLRTPIRHFPRRSREGGRLRPDVNVLCKIRFTGKAAFYGKKLAPFGPGMTATLSNQLELTFAGAQLISAAPVPANAQQVCGEYASLVLNKKQVDVVVRNYSKEVLQIGHLPLEIENRPDDKLANGPLLYGFGPNSLGEESGADRFFVRKGVASIDITSTALKELSGEYFGRTPLGDRLELVIHDQHRQLVLTSHACGLKATLDIESVLVEKGYMRMRGTPFSTLPFKTTAGSSQGRSRTACETFEEVLEDFSKEGFALSYNSHLCRKDCASTFVGLRLGRVAEQLADDRDFRGSAILYFEQK